MMFNPASITLPTDTYESVSGCNWCFASFVEDTAKSGRTPKRVSKPQ